jgi:hypothetical protein
MVRNQFYVVPNRGSSAGSLPYRGEPENQNQPSREVVVPPVLAISSRGDCVGDKAVVVAIVRIVLAQVRREIPELSGE